MQGISTIFEDDQIIVINKKSGLAVQGGEKVTASVDDILARQLGQRPFLVHRLDKDTSGILLVAKTKAAAAHYSQLLAGKQVVKLYAAVCAGHMKASSGRITEPVFAKGREQAALTHFKVKSAQARFSWLELELGTGRMHQIRLHLAGIGHPILGDDKYGDFTLNKQYRREQGLKHLLLHAQRLVIEGTVFEAPVPDYFSPYLATSVFPVKD